jgi:hypothetical protein
MNTNRVNHQYRPGIAEELMKVQEAAATVLSGAVAPG